MGDFTEPFFPEADFLVGRGSPVVRRGQAEGINPLYPERLQKKSKPCLAAMV